MLFWIVAYALGSHRRFFDVGVGLGEEARDDDGVGAVALLFDGELRTFLGDRLDLVAFDVGEEV